MPTKSIARTKTKKAETAPARKVEASSTKKAVADTGAEARFDFPRQNEQVAAGHYAVRLSAPSGSVIEVTTDGKNWQPCREAAGYFWSDWWPASAGRVTLSLRVKANGKWKKGADRAVTVTANGKH